MSKATNNKQVENINNFFKYRFFETHTQQSRPPSESDMETDADLTIAPATACVMCGGNFFERGDAVQHLADHHAVTEGLERAAGLVLSQVQGGNVTCTDQLDSKEHQRSEYSFW